MIYNNKEINQCYPYEHYEDLNTSPGGDKHIIVYSSHIGHKQFYHGQHIVGLPNYLSRKQSIFLITLKYICHNFITSFIKLIEIIRWV